MTAVTKKIIFHAPIEKAYNVIADIKSYPEFLDEIEEVAIESLFKSGMVVSFKMNLIRRIEYTLKFKFKKPTTVSWEMVSGQIMKYNNGSWVLKKLGVKKTEAVYTVDVGFGLLVPGVIVKGLMENSLPKMLDDFRRRIEGR